MRIRAKPSRRRAERITLEMASMIDVVFLLLIFFLVTTVIERQEDRLSPTLQTQREDASGTAADFQPQVVDVEVRDGSPAYRLGTRVLRDRAGLSAALEPLPKSVGIFVKVHGGVDVGFAVAAIQLARDAGFEQVTYVPAS